MAKVFGFRYSQGDEESRETALSSADWKALSHPAPRPEHHFCSDHAFSARDIAADVTEMTSRLHSLLK